MLTSYPHRPAPTRGNLQSYYPFLDFTKLMGYYPPPPEHEDPGLMATIGPIRVLISTQPREYIVGRAQDSDFVLNSEYSLFTSMQMTL